MTHKELIESCYLHRHQGDVLLAGYRLELAVKLLERVIAPSSSEKPVTHKEVKDFLALNDEPLTVAQADGDGPQLV